MIKTIFRKAYNTFPVIRKLYAKWYKFNLKPIRIFKENKLIFTDKAALEIGGPTPSFERGNIFPIYDVLSSLDNCNFSGSNFWSEIKDGEKLTFNNNKITGNQIVTDATDLSKFSDSSYDLLLNSHVIEHIANPLKALFEWKRVIVSNGLLVMIVPHKEGTYDHKRPLTALQHIIDDFSNDIKEDDKTLIAVFLNLHDIDKDSTVTSYEDHVIRTQDNFARRIVHHHVFDTRLVASVVDHAGFKILDIQPCKPYHIFIIAQKVADETSINNQSFLDDRLFNNLGSPFKSDTQVVKENEVRPICN